MDSDAVSFADAAVAAVVGTLLPPVLHDAGAALLPATLAVQALDLVALGVPVYVAVAVLVGEDRSVAAPGVSWTAATVAVVAAAVLWLLRLLLVASGGGPLATAATVVVRAGYAGTVFVAIKRLRRSSSR